MTTIHGEGLYPRSTTSHAVTGKVEAVNHDVSSIEMVVEADLDGPRIYIQLTTIDLSKLTDSEGHQLADSTRVSSAILHLNSSELRQLVDQLELLCSQ